MGQILWTSHGKPYPPWEVDGGWGAWKVGVAEGREELKLVCKMIKDCFKDKKWVSREPIHPFTMQGHSEQMPSVKTWVSITPVET